MNVEVGVVSHRVLEALFNGVYQGQVVAGLLWLALKCAGRWNAATRHAVGFAGLLIIAALPLVHLGESLWLELSPSLKRAKPDVLAPMESFVPEDVVPAAASAPEPAVPESSWEVPLPQYFSLSAIALWLAIAVVRFAGLARQCAALRGIKRQALPALPEVRSRFDVLRTDMGVRRPVRLGLSERVRTPIAAGFFHPMVLVPEGSEQERPARLDAILRHELAHVRRRDDWTNLAQQMIQALFFFHPGVHWLSSRLTVEREIACDDHALASLSSRRDYALLLAEFASRSATREWGAAPGVWSKQGQLKERITMIMNAKRNASTRLARASAGMLTVGAVLVALLVMQAGPRVALADETAPSGEGTLLIAADASVDTTTEIAVSADAAASPRGESRAYTVISGPRKKERDILITAPAPIAAPVAVPMAQIAPAAEPVPGKPPRPPRAANPPARNLEERLARLERMVEGLTKENKNEFHHEMHFDFKHPDMDPKFHDKMAKLHKDIEAKFNSPEWHEKMRRIEEDAARAGERAAREVERKVRIIERDGKVQYHAELRENGKLRRKALEEQRRALEEQLEGLEEQIERIEEEEERAEEARERAEEERERAEEARERAQEERERAENQQRENEGDGPNKAKTLKRH